MIHYVSHIISVFIRFLYENNVVRKTPDFDLRVLISNVLYSYDFANSLVRKSMRFVNYFTKDFCLKLCCMKNSVKGFEFRFASFFDFE